ncbi:lipase family protein [Hoyosella subflava]|uniref:Uncharacterized protein n=1 Tax=Hoyosella subflava (strain DSM 45089 / JCM 17490 / NBRC 109087 / DQS3-9A1) TaxID=443218 RepID=F6EJ34_HOYSD|nr:hypothetical protein [Hoyosella subflava]AEF41266.1 hypothetical protein AS9A_2819 [Hoyosella subflava DQS3-9A1]
MKIVFLHGIGDGDPSAGWLDGLNRGLVQLGHQPLDENRVIAPRYSSLLKTDGISAKMPPVTYKPNDELNRRRGFERRQAAVQRKIGKDAGVQSFGFHYVPERPMQQLTSLAVNKSSFYDFDQVRRYVKNDGLRGAILERILDHLPSYGDVVLIGHSLGSVISIDLLDHLSDNLNIRRFITIGSPAHSRALHEGSERLLKKFPYGRVDDWSNFLDTRDIVTGGRGLAGTFPGAQDFIIDNGASHSASAYLGHSAVARLVAQMVYPTKEMVLASSNIAVRMSDNEVSVLLMLHYAEAVRRHIKDKGVLERYEHALNVLRDDLVGQIESSARASGQPLAPELRELVSGRLPTLPHRWELHEAVQELVVLAVTNIVDPFEIDTGRASRDALPDVAVAMGFRRDPGVKIATAIEEVQRSISRRGGAPWGRYLTAAVGLGILAAGPVGLMVAAPASVFGAAAITGGLAAFGPGGMVGGLAMLGGLAGTGAALTTAAATHGMGGSAPVTDATSLILRVATEYARKLLDLSYDETLWYALSHAETQFAAKINRLEAFCDPKAAQLTKLKEAWVIVSRLMTFMIEKGMTPRMLAQEAPKPEGSEATRPSDGD